MKISLVATISILVIGCALPSTISKTSQVEAGSPSVIPESKSSSSSAQAKPIQIQANAKSRFGNFISGEHSTNGKVSIVKENGIYFIEFDQTFKTSENGPDLFVILHRSPDILQISKPPDYGIAEGDYVAIAPLKNFNGKQRYEIPSNIQPDVYQSVAVWCRKYNATFGFAPLAES